MTFSDPAILMSCHVGVLALQGAFAKHIEMLRSLGAVGVEIREPVDLDGVDALILPGGESTTISRMLVRWGLIEPIRSLIDDQLPVFGTCAGLIHLADHLVHWDDMPRIGGLHLSVERNAYGRQIDSFEAALEIEIHGAPEFQSAPFGGVFIRSPKILPESVTEELQVLCRFEGIPVLVRQQNILGGSFHPELSGDGRLHEWFLREMVKSAGS